MASHGDSMTAILVSLVTCPNFSRREKARRARYSAIDAAVEAWTWGLVIIPETYRTAFPWPGTLSTWPAGGDRRCGRIRRMAEARRGAMQRLAGGSGVTIAVAVMNVTAYAFTIVAARWLGPSEFGAVGALMGLLLVLNVAGLALQT